jgi:hypothetical protein
LNVGIAEDHTSHLGCAYVAGEVDAHSLFFQAGKILPERPPVRVDFVVLVTGTIGFNNGVVQRRD